MKIAWFVCGIFCAICSATALADSPITSTDFFTAYEDLEIVCEARAKGVIDREIAEYLLSENNAVDHKAAVVNALSWKFEGKENALVFRIFLALKYSTDLDHLDLDALTSDELLCLGYLTVLDNYFEPSRAIPILEMAWQKNQDSYTVNIVLALARAQQWMEYDWCLAWLTVKEVRENQALQRDLRPAAERIIFDYMELYENYCHE